MSDLGDDRYAEMREYMLQVIGLHVRHSAALAKEEIDPQVVAAMAGVPRHEFVPNELAPYAYMDTPLPIGFDKTISQPFIVALMTDLLDVRSGDRVLEVGTGLGYHSAVLSRLAAEVFSVEIVDELAEQARRNLARLRCDNVRIRVGDGSRGWIDQAPFDRITVAAAPEMVPKALIEQLKPGGRLVIPAGLADSQMLMVIDKAASGRVSSREVLAVRFGALESYH